MAALIDEYLQHLRLQYLGDGVFRGESRYTVAPNHVYGGQVMAQALSAASQTVEGRPCHAYSVHFLLGGNTADPIDYHVSNTKDGRNFSSRQVIAVQGGRKLLSLEAAFQSPAEGFDRQQVAPVCPDPESLCGIEDYRAEFEARGQMDLYDFLVASNVFEFRCTDKPSYLETRNREPVQQMWLRAKYPIPLDPMLQRVVLAYISDHNFLRTASLPYRALIEQYPFQFASLNQSMWIHRPFDLNDWLLYDIVSPSVMAQRALAIGHFYTRSGSMVATAVQEGVLRQLPPGQIAAFSENI